MKELRKEIQDELEKLAPSLSKLKKEEKLEVPENYFQQLPDQILSQINFEKNEPVQQAVPTKNWLDGILEKIAFLLQPRVAVAFGAVLLLLVSLVLLNKNSTEASTDLFAEIPEVEMEAYLKANVDQFEEEMFYELADEVASNDFEIELEEEDLDNYMEEIIDDLDDSDLEDFL